MKLEKLKKEITDAVEEGEEDGESVEKKE